MARISFKAQPDKPDPCPGWDGKPCGAPNKPMGRMTDDKWSGMCMPCTELYKDAILRWQAAAALKSGRTLF